MNLHCYRLSAGVLLLATAGLAGCNSTPIQANACIPPEDYQLDTALAQARNDLGAECSFRFDAYLQRLLEIAQDDPGPANKEKFSQFLVWAQRQGLISRLQAQNLYNRYFNVKFVSLSGDYNNCDSSCRDPSELLVKMEGELLDKELGLLKISRDQAGYQRADRLYQEVELVLEATCRACEGR